jgi:hypothetical protein
MNTKITVKIAIICYFDIYFLIGLMLRNGDWLAAGLAEGIVTTAAARGKHLVAVVL